MAKVKMKMPEGCTSFSHGGIQYDADAKGECSVEADAVEALYPYGFGNVGNTEQDKSADAKAKK